ncbi:dTMP kinase [Candidatus Peribacteria bacterium]|nr:dTMP kinase [Candidatus Peribacteria bacterium]
MLLFIVLDGPDATGTTTHAELLAARLTKEGHSVLLTSEPTDGPIGKQIRQALRAGTMDPMELQLLFTKDRAWHVEHVIEPALKAGKIVVCDRYWHSTIIYAGAQGLDSTELKKLNNAFIQPSLVFFTLPPIEVSLKRMAKRTEKEIFEKEEMQRKIHDGYANLAKEQNGIRVIDTSGDKGATAETIYRIAAETL